MRLHRLLACLFAFLPCLAAEPETASGAKPEAVLVVPACDVTGMTEVFALRDAEMTLSVVDLESLLIGLTPEEIARLVPEGEVKLHTQAFLLKREGLNILVDAGAGKGQGGVMLESLALAGVQPEDVDAVLLTHLHFDHVGGLEHDGEAVFPKAAIHLSQDELDAWTTDEGVTRLPDSQKDWAVLAQKALAPYAGRIHAFSRNPEILFPFLDGGAEYRLVHVPTPGHTPGHAWYVLGQTGTDASVCFAGDLWHLAEIQMARPETTLVFDVDPEQARGWRVGGRRTPHDEGFLSFLAKNAEDMRSSGMAAFVAVAGAHLPFPGIGMVEAREEGFAFVPFAEYLDAAGSGRGDP